MSVPELLHRIRQDRRLVLALVAGVGVFFAGSALLKPRVYQASAIVLPHASSATGRISGIAAQFGIAVAATDAAQSPAFYGALLRSREVLDSVVLATYEDGGSQAQPRSLIDWWEVGGDSHGERVEEAVEELENRMDVQVDRQTGLVSITVEAESPNLAYGMMARILDMLGRINVERRQTVASAEREFVSDQMHRAQAALRTAENEMQQFLERNRTWSTDPKLVFEHDRLQRAVAMRQDVFTSLAQSHEQARIDAVRNTPPLAVVERPRVPARPASSGIVSRTILGLLLGALLAVCTIILRPFLRSGERNAEKAVS